jgi:hypothetical protein
VIARILNILRRARAWSTGRGTWFVFIFSALILPPLALYAATWADTRFPARLGTNAVAVVADADFGTGFVVERDGKLIVITSLDIVERVRDAKVYVFHMQPRGNREEVRAVGFDARVIGADRKNRIAALSLDGMTQDDVKSATLNELGEENPHGRVTVSGSKALRGSQVATTGTSPSDELLTTYDQSTGRLLAAFPPGPGFRGAPVYAGNGQIVGMAVGQTMAVHVAKIRSFVQSLPQDAGEAPNVEAVKSGLKVYLRNLNDVINGKSKIDWSEFDSMSLDWEEVPDSARFGKIHVLDPDAIDDLLAPSDAAILDEEAQRILPNGENKNKGAGSTTPETAKVRRELAAYRMRMLMGDGTSEWDVGEVKNGLLPSTYHVEVQDKAHEWHTLCVVKEHGRVAASLFDCEVDANSGRRTTKYPWMLDRELARLLRGVWRATPCPDGPENPRAKPRDDISCRLDDASRDGEGATTLEIQSINGVKVTGRLTLFQVLSAERAKCEVKLSEGLSGTLINRELRLFGSPVPAGGSTLQPTTSGDACKDRRFSGTTFLRIPMGDGEADWTAPLDLKVTRRDEADPASSLIQVVPAWRGVLRPWNLENRLQVYCFKRAEKRTVESK